ncbi:MAG: aldo/keto reductase [Pirellulaceae bacterium]|nr:aldo/keto reductase [Pirellulaceae bacterium]
MSGLDRRTFLAASAGAAAYLTAHTRAAIAAESESPIPPTPPEVLLAGTDVKMSRVGQGTGMHGGNRQSDHTRMGFEKLVALMHHAYDRGVTFFDLADLYGTHLYCREALRSIPREKIAILTKLWWQYDGPVDPVAPAHCKNIAKTTLDRFRHELNTDYLDIVLLHCVTTPKWPQQLQPYMDALSEAKDKKRVRAVGVSCHNFQAMEVAAECPWVDVLLARINPRGAKMDGPVDDVVRVLRKTKENGKAVIGMKIYGEGTLADQKDECIQFAQGLGLLDAMTVGALTPEQMDETLRLVGKYPAAPLIG